MVSGGEAGRSAAAARGDTAGRDGPGIIFISLFPGEKKKKKRGRKKKNKPKKKAPRSGTPRGGGWCCRERGGLGRAGPAG